MAMARKAALGEALSNSIANHYNSDGTFPQFTSGCFTFGPRPPLPLLFFFGAHLARGPHLYRDVFAGIDSDLGEQMGVRSPSRKLGDKTHTIRTAQSGHTFCRKQRFS